MINLGVTLPLNYLTVEDPGKTNLFTEKTLSKEKWTPQKENGLVTVSAKKWDEIWNDVYFTLPETSQIKSSLAPGTVQWDTDQPLLLAAENKSYVSPYFSGLSVWVVSSSSLEWFNWKGCKWFERWRKNKTSVTAWWGFCPHHISIFVQFSSVAQSCPTLCDPMNRSTPGLPVHHQLLEITQTHVHRVSDAIQPSHPLLSPSPPSPNPSQHQGLFQWVNSSNEVAKVLEFQLQHHSFQWTPRTDLLRMDWLDLLAVQGTLKSLLQHHGSKASILQRSTFFIVQLSHPYMTTGKTIALARWTFVDKVMSLLFNMLSRLVITFLPRSKHLLVSWLQSPSAVILELKKK